VRTAADRIRERIKKTVEDIIEVGNDFLAVKSWRTKLRTMGQTPA
jgi:hypothetical protein